MYGSFVSPCVTKTSYSRLPLQPCFRDAQESTQTSASVVGETVSLINLRCTQHHDSDLQDQQNPSLLVAAETQSQSVCLPQPCLLHPVLLLTTSLQGVVKMCYACGHVINTCPFHERSAFNKKENRVWTFVCPITNIRRGDKENGWPSRKSKGVDCNCV